MYTRRQKMLTAAWEGFKSIGTGLALSAVVLFKIKTSAWFSALLVIGITGFITFVLVRKKNEEIQEIEYRMQKKDFKIAE